MIKHLFFVCQLFAIQGIVAQTNLSWENFIDVDFSPGFNEVYQDYFLKPTFGEKILPYKGKEVSIQGYFLDITGNGEVLLISQNPMVSCFFCGAAGPESVIEVNFKEKPDFKTDQIVLVTGILELNEFDVDHFNYILNEATGQLIQ